MSTVQPLQELEELPPDVAELLLEQADLHALERTKFYRLFPETGPLARHNYPRHMEFFEAGARYKERLLMAANRVGKTEAGAFEATCHLTGEYPSWWKGRRFLTPVDGWTAGDTSLTVRDIQQLKMLGRWGEFGTGMIPAERIIKALPKNGVPEAVESVQVRHISGGISTLGFRSYDQGRLAFQGTSKHFVWPDEEPPADVYAEMVTRTMDVSGTVFITFTPLRGLSPTVIQFMPKGKILKGEEGKFVVQATWDDAPHLSPQQRDELWRALPAHEREARSKGIPQLGSGRIFPVAEEVFREGVIQIPDHWVRIIGMDFGWDHPTAAAWLAWDRDADVVHVYDIYRASGSDVLRERGVPGTPIVHAAAMKRHGDWIPVAWPMDGLQHDKGSGMQLAQQYRDQELNMLMEPAQFEETDEDGETRASRVSVEAGVAMMLDRMQTGRLRVAAHLQEFWEEFRLYHRKDGKIIKEGDDVISAIRYGLMMLRYAIEKPKDLQLRMGRSRPPPNWRAT